MARLTFVGHATVGVRIGDSLLLTDPILRRRVAFLRWTAAAQGIGSLRTARAVLISHLHHDHCDLPSLTLLGRDTEIVVPEGGDAFLRSHGFTRLVPMRPGSTHTIGDVHVLATEAEHDGRRRPRGPSAPALGYVLSGPDVRIYFAGDTDLFDGMRELAGHLDIALLPVSGWGPTLGPGHLDPVRAAEAVARTAPALAVPIHWGALRPLWQRVPPPAAICTPARTFEAEVRRRRLPADVAVLLPGTTLSWPPEPT